MPVNLTLERKPSVAPSAAPLVVVLQSLAGGGCRKFPAGQASLRPVTLGSCEPALLRKDRLQDSPSAGLGVPGVHRSLRRRCCSPTGAAQGFQGCLHKARTFLIICVRCVPVHIAVFFASVNRRNFAERRLGPLLVARAWRSSARSTQR